MKITVTQQHIDQGLRGSCTGDPIALAMRDAGFSFVWVAPDRIEGDALTFHIPEDVVEFMKCFDNERFVSPFTFELEG
jgi:hypothetical protein